MAELWKILGILLFISGQFGSVSTQGPHVCKTFGSGVIQMFNETMFHVKSTCPVILTHFSHAGVDCFISVQREPTGFMNRVQILVNKVVTIIQDGILSVEGNSISLPYDHTYQSVYTFGIYTRLTSKVLPLSVTWYSLPEGVTSLWVQLDQPLVDGMTGMCGGQNSSENRAQLLDRNVIHDGICVIGDSQPVDDMICKEFKSQARECIGWKLNIFDQLCKLNMYINVDERVKCSFYEEFIRLCNGSYAKQSKLRNITSCKEHHCPGDLLFKDRGAAFPPTCSNPQLHTESFTSTCLPPNGLVLNDLAKGYHCVKVEDCPCVHRGRTYAPGQTRSSKCQTCECIKGKWICSANTCPTLCVIEGWFVTTFDGKQYSLPGKCSYVAARGLNWTVTIKFSDITIEEMYLDVYQERYTFSLNSVQLKENKITLTDLSQTEHVTVYWLSSMFVMVQTTFGMKMQVQVSPEVQMYLYVPQSIMTRGLCGSYNNNTEDDFTTSSGIVENSAQPFALSWTLGDCTPNNPHVCINTDNEIFAEDKCSQLTNASGVFAQCHDYVPVNTYFDACVQRTCQATSNLEEHICIGLGNYAKACTSQGINIGDWRKETACTHSCNGNLRFEYNMQACNRTCRSLSGPDPACDMPDDPVEGCGCPSGTHLNTPLECSPRALCHCSYPGGTTPPGAVVIDGRQCMCANGFLQCSDVCDCPPGQICVHCAQAPVNTEHRTCESLSKPSSGVESCVSGCYCPEGQYADHTGSCVTQENCTCEFSGMVYASGQSVESNCKTCTCRGGQWNCKGDPCPGVCEVFGNGQYKTFDSKWYRFDGHCQYTLVEDIHGLFSIKAESVPCCDEVLTCSRSISVKLKDEVTLILRDMNVTQKLLDGWHFRAQSLYTVHTVGLYIIISVPELGLSLIWDKQTKVKIELQASWNGKVRGLCGDFDGKLMNDMLTSSSTVVFSTLEFGNSWKAAVPPCSDVTQELFPCERHSYCAAWAQRRCMILHSDTFKDCHLKVDPSSYYQACVLESCSCDFEGKFLGFCTAVAAYADACRTQNVCVKWRTPDLCPVYCDYYNEEGQCSWHYEACPYQIKTCGKSNKFFGELEGCYPRCPAEKPYYDENRRMCSRLDNCTCYFNNTVVEPGAKVTTPNECCDCIGGQIICGVCVAQLPTKTSTALTTTTPLTTTKTIITPLTTIVYTTQTTHLDIVTGAKSTPLSHAPQNVINTTTTPATTTTKTTEKTITTTQLTTTTTETTEITTKSKITTEKYETTVPLTTKTEKPATTSTPKITTVHKTTNPLTIASVTTTIPGMTTEESASPTSVSTSTTRITTEEHKATPPFTTTTKKHVTTTVPEITTEESSSTLQGSTSTTRITTEETKATTQFTTTTETPVTTTMPGLRTEESESTTPVFRATTRITTEGHKTTPPFTTTTKTLVTTTIPGITTEESASTTPEWRSTTRITTEEPKTTTQFTTTETPVTTTIPGLTTEESESTTPEFRATTRITTEGHKTTPPVTRITEKPVKTTVPGITTEESSSTTQGSTSTTRSTTEEYKKTTPFTSTIETTVIPKITTVHETTTSVTEAPVTSSEIPLTTTSTITETTVTTTTSIPEITTEQPKTTTPLTTTETLITTSTPKITTVSKTTTSLTTKQTPTTSEITPEESASTTPLTTSLTTTETPITTSTSELTKTPITPLNITAETTVTPSTLKTSPVPTTPLTTTTLTTKTAETPPPASTPENTREALTSVSPGTTTETPVTTTKISYEEPKITTLLTTSETSVTTPTPKITTIPKPTSPITTTTTEILTTTSTPEITTGELASTSLLTTPETTQPNIYTGTKSTLFSPGPQVSATTLGTTTTKITEKPTTTTPLTTNTTETIVFTTSTPKMTTELKTTAPLTTVSKTHTTTTTSLGILTEKSASTTPLTITLTTTVTPVSVITTKKPVTTPVTTTATPKSTTVPNTGCKDLIRNQSWPEGYEWTEDCFNKICINSVIELRPMLCPTSVMPVCPRGMPQLVKDEQGCCDTWQCDCQCDVFGDPHYTTFAGQDFSFLENCTYVLVKERISHHYLSISIDNYYCEPSASCAKGIILKYHNNTVILQVLQVSEEMPVLETTLNQVTIKPPYQADGLRFESTDTEVYIYIEEIRSYIFLSVWNTLQINLAMEHFFNNTQGQCGVCGGASCIRRDGSAESEDCCEKTAYEWIEDDPLKPYCQQSQRHVPCFPDKSQAPTSPPVIVPPPCMAPPCELLRHEVFSECSRNIDVEKLVSNCKFDYCVAQSNATVCSTLERLADHCKKLGFCVAWRNLTNGICDITCPEGMILDECRSTPTDFCRGGVRVPGTALDTVRSGCFCPGNQLLAETHKKICVSECTNCKGPLGEPMPVGAVWESNCHICTCNNQTLTEECWPKPSAPTPTCSPDSTLITDCCNNQICVEKTCEYNGTIYKVGETWRDNQSPCVKFRCTREGTEIEKNVCPQLFCPKELRVWDEHHCCYSCNTTCGVRLSKMTIENCTQEVMLPTCEGNCGSMWVKSGNDLQYNQFCCRERNYEIRQISLVCSRATATQYTYKHITSCECHGDI